MKLRTKLLLAELPFVAALITSAAVAIWTAAEVGRAPLLIQRENFRSFDAAQSMRDSLEQLERSARASLASQAPMLESRASGPASRFEQALRTQETNITEAGEAQATARVRRAWRAYQAALSHVSAATYAGDASRVRAEQLVPAYTRARDAVEAIFAINRHAMEAKSERANQRAHSAIKTLVLASLIALLVGAVASSALLRRVLAPVGVLTLGVRRLSQGDFGARLQIRGSDEIAELSSAFNRMAENLAAYRASSVGELLRTERRARDVLDALPDPAIVLDLKGAIVTANRAAQTLLGIGDGTVPDELKAPLERIHGAVRGGQSFEPQSLEVQHDAERHVFLPQAGAVYDEIGTIAGVALVLRDVTRLSRVDDLQSQLVATAAHEFRTPLTSLHMAVHLCLERAAGPMTDKQTELLQAARVDCERLQALVDDMLQAAKLEAGTAHMKQERCVVGVLVADARNVFDAAAAAKGVALGVTTGDPLLCVSADRTKIARVFANLIQNALRHTAHGGAITLGYRLDGDFVRFEVVDTGEGIPPEHREHLFEKFFRVPGREQPGVGLGLHIVREIVQSHGGQVGVEGEVGAGATVWFTLPAQE